jgi:hypothetical protein
MKGPLHVGVAPDLGEQVMNIKAAITLAIVCGLAIGSFCAYAMYWAG